MCLLNLPAELTLLISDLLWPSDLNALARTSRDFAYFLDPLLQDRALIDPMSVLFWAAKNGRKETVDLLDYLVRTLGADLSARVPIYTTEDAPCCLSSAIYTKPTTALHAAALGRNEAATGRLIELGADVNAVDGDGASPLHYAAHNPTGTPAVVRLMLEHGNKTETEDHWQGRPLHRAYWPMVGRMTQRAVSLTFCPCITR